MMAPASLQLLGKITWRDLKRQYQHRQSGALRDGISGFRANRGISALVKTGIALIEKKISA
jgi:hypothetical protein